MVTFVGVVSLLGGIFVMLRLLYVSLDSPGENLSFGYLSGASDGSFFIPPSLGASLWRTRLMAVVRFFASGLVVIGVATSGD